jgi:molybdopterin converting factor small subunit
MWHFLFDTHGGGGEEVQNGWLLLVYKIPSEPSRYRVQVWRKVKATGALYLQNSICVLPAGRGHEQELRRLRYEIEKEYGGEAYLFHAELLGPPGTLEELFNRSRDEEYAEVAHRCREFFAELEEETANQHFTFAELEENEEDLLKLEQWYAKIKRRDFFGSPRSAEVAKMLAECRARLEAFAERVFAASDRPETKEGVREGP